MKLRIRHLVIMTLLLLALAPGRGLGAEDAWKFLDDFTPVPSSLTRISENYVAMIFENRPKQLVAAVIFKASCVAGRCELSHRAGYAASNRQGSNTRVYVEPGEKELIDLIGAIAAGQRKIFS